MPDKLYEAYIQITSKSTYEDDFKKAVKDSEKSARQIEQNFEKAKLHFDNTIARKSIADVEKDISRLQALLKQKMEVGADIGTLTAIKSRIDTASQAIEQFKGNFDKVKPSVDKGTMSLSNFMMIVTGLNQATELVGKVAGSLKDMVEKSLDLQVLRDNFQGTEQDLKNFSAAVAGTVGTGDLIKLSNQATDLGISLKDQTIFFALAEDAADKYGISTEEGFQKIVMASEGQGKGLKALGIERAKYNELVNQMAQAHGDAIAKLDAETQKEIRLQAIIQLSGYTFEKATSKIADNKDMYEQLNVDVEKSKIKLGQLLDEALVPIIKSLNDSGDAGKYLVGSIGLLSGTILPLLPTLFSFLTMTRLQKVASAEATVAMDAEAASAGRLGLALKTLGGWAALGIAAGLAIGKVWDMIREKYGAMNNGFDGSAGADAFAKSNTLDKQTSDFLSSDKRYVPGQGVFTIKDDKGSKTKTDGKELTDEQKQALELKKKSLDEYYSFVTFKDDSYYDYRVKQIKKEADELAKNSKGKIDRELYVQEQLKKLDEQKLQFKFDNNKKEYDDESAKINNEETINLLFLDSIKASDSEKLEFQKYYLNERLELAKKYLGEESAEYKKLSDAARLNDVKIDIAKADEADKKKEFESKKQDTLAQEYGKESDKDLELKTFEEINALLIQAEIDKSNALREIRNAEDEKELQRLTKQKELLDRKIEMIDAEKKARLQAAEQAIESYAMEYDATKAFGTQLANAIRQNIKAYLAKALAAEIAGTIASNPLYGIFIAPMMGMAVSALFDSIIPKFSTGGEFEVPINSSTMNDGALYRANAGEIINIRRGDIPTSESKGGGISDSDMRELIQSVKAMNENLIMKEMKVTANLTVDGKQLAQVNKSNENRMARNGNNLNDY